jgi:uncharacterized protein YndB with AHSA1/START domain
MFAIEKSYPVPASRVFAAFASPAIKRQWFAAEKASQIDEFAMDFRVGGRELTRLRFEGGPEGAPAKGTEVRNDTTYLDIVHDRRIVFAYTMTIGDKRISASLATVELREAGSHTQLLFTEQAAFFEGADGPRLREGGWRDLLRHLDEALSHRS